MRLVDAYALKKDLTRFYDNEVTAKQLIDEQPTIDAIPVEWLNKQCEMADDRGDMEMTDAISWLIQTWHEEQEAR